MTHRRFIIFTGLAIGLITLIKLFFFATLNIDNAYIVYFMWLLIALVSIACSRRLGIMQYAESALVIGLWLLGTLFLDLLILSALFGNDIYRHLYLWISYAVMAVCVFLFHKKRHVHIRRQMREAAAEKNSRH